jgi:nicotinamidase-related amidase
MKARNHSKKQAAAKSKVALLLIDVINDMEFPLGDALLRRAAEPARRIAALKRRAHALGVPVIYVNDNFGCWQSDFAKIVRHCLDDGVRGASIARLLLPGEGDYFVLKPKHSGFFSTPLELLLKDLGAETLILTGFATNLCVLYTANDAYMHDFHIYVPRDCTAAERPDVYKHALDHMEHCLKADVRTASRIPLAALCGARRSASRSDGLARYKPSF